MSADFLPRGTQVNKVPWEGQVSTVTTTTPLQLTFIQTLLSNLVNLPRFFPDEEKEKLSLRRHTDLPVICQSQCALFPTPTENPSSHANPWIQADAVWIEIEVGLSIPHVRKVLTPVLLQSDHLNALFFSFHLSILWMGKPRHGTIK